MFLSRDRLETTLLTSSERASFYTDSLLVKPTLIASLGEVRMPGAWIKETHSPLSQSFHSQWVGVFVSCCGRGVTSGRASASFIANPSLLTGGFLTPVGGKSTPACSGCQGNITTYCIPCRDGPNGPYQLSPSTGNSHAC